MTSVSLFASATRLPCAERGERRLEPRRADHGVEHDVDVVALAASTRQIGPTLQCAVRVRSPSLDRCPRSSAGTARPARRAASALLYAVSAATRNRRAAAIEHAQRRRPIDPVEPRIATPRGARSAPSSRRATVSMPIRAAMYDTGRTKNRLSQRSRTPPCPGMMRELSFTPASRLSSDSARSPTCAATLTSAPNSRTPSGAHRKSELCCRVQYHPAYTPTRPTCSRRVRQSRPRPSFPGLPTA